MALTFDSRNEYYKKPYGAVPCNTVVSFCLTPEEHFVSCTLLLSHDFSGEKQTVSLSKEGFNFVGTYCVPKEPDLIWYAFSFTREDGSIAFYGKNGYCNENELSYYQQTVYDARFFTPSWFGKGITYQIFPDRFFRDGRPSSLRPGRIFHENWQDEPAFLPDGDGDVRNCDFFGGNLRGITQKLPYLKSLGVTTIYLNPICESFSNHHYDTGDYMKIDELLGNDSDFMTLCKSAKALGIHILLDGVFNHTGSDSRYFNAKGTYSDVGAAQSQTSPYSDWYSFSNWPNEYAAWWGVKTLPAVNENNPKYRDYIIRSRDSVVRHYLKMGASGWRLDVADELPDDFIAEIRSAMDKENPDTFLLGEVWEDASNKIAYDERRKYLLGKELNGIMNYPLRTAILNWLFTSDAKRFVEDMETQRENYPKDAFYSGLNILGTHDTPRILTALGISRVPESKIDRSNFRLSDDEKALGIKRLRLAATLLFAFPGSPTIYYGDEVGMEGLEDPFCRRTYPWGNENLSLLALYRALGDTRSSRKSLQEGDIHYLYSDNGCLVIQRSFEGETTLAVLNAGNQFVELQFPWSSARARDALLNQRFLIRDGVLSLSVPALTPLLIVDE